MAIGVFDSGFGGLTVLDAVSSRLPRADIVYLADQAHMPYGALSGLEIVDLTWKGCVRLFEAGCDLVVLACNTASAVALRSIQTDCLPDYRRALGHPVNVLGIIVPTIEAVTGRQWNATSISTHSPEPKGPEPKGLVGVFATEATARSEVYEIEIVKRAPDLSVFSEPCPGLAAMIERGAPGDALRNEIERHAAALIQRAGSVPDQIILGCTHYELAADLFRRALPPSTRLIRQPDSVAESMVDYLSRHAEFSGGAHGLRRFLTTGSSQQDGRIESLRGMRCIFEPA